ncbi:hypothetical protein [Planotetraspora mira]|uniref:Uncharacterized protein n=1 Tax=Planotetraspora mira TaxID=58121 RepID=A0A8J3TXD5_9ACTN|nr:hypothetical protein [Planotetraspora mira]GII34269.1 hypothetical protein Pmi06nite_77110 [Planotetraspora mira]
MMRVDPDGAVDGRLRDLAAAGDAGHRAGSVQDKAFVADACAGLLEPVEDGHDLGLSDGGDGADLSGDVGVFNGHRGHQSVAEGAEVIVTMAGIGPDVPTGTFRYRNGAMPW